MTVDGYNFFQLRFDTTDTGHILGRAKNLNAIPYPERKLNRANCAILKFMLHMAMYIGANKNIQVSQVINKYIKEH